MKRSSPAAKSGFAGGKESRIFVVTGGIGSGKSAVCRILAERFPGRSADEAARRVLESPAVEAQIRARLTDQFYRGKVLDRRAFGRWVFASEERTRVLDEIVHPAVYDELLDKARALGGIVFCEIPLYFETGATFPCAGVWVVAADPETRIRRVMARDGLTRREVEDRMSRQTSLKSAGTAYTVIENNGNERQLREAVKDALRSL